MTLRLRGRPSGDDGIAMITVMAAVGIISTLILTSLALADSSLRSSRAHSSFESALAVAEAGVDQTLAAVSTAYNGVPSSAYVTGGSCAVGAPTPAQVASADAERRWIRDALLALPSSCAVPSAQGDFVAVRPAGRNAVYSMAWSPSRTAPGAKRRLIKAEYVFAPYKPTNAILTNGNIDLSGSVTTNATDPSIPANVHTNANVLDYNNSLTVNGSVSATGTLPGGCPSKVTGTCTDAQPKQELPVIDPRSIYNSYALITPQWFDLCRDAGGVASVHKPASTGPCSGDLITKLGISGSPVEFQGWSMTVSGGIPLWTLASGAASYPGAYYVYGGNAQIGGNGNSKEDRFVTVMAEGLPTGGAADRCGKFGGDISWKLFSLRPYLSGLVLAAQGSLLGGANADAGPGLFVAGDKIDLKTSSSTIQGAIIAGNKCAAAGTNTVQGITVTYDDTVEAPVNDVIRTTLWLEYQSG